MSDYSTFFDAIAPWSVFPFWFVYSAICWPYLCRPAPFSLVLSIALSLSLWCSICLYGAGLICKLSAGPCAVPTVSDAINQVAFQLWLLVTSVAIGLAIVSDKLKMHKGCRAEECDRSLGFRLPGCVLRFYNFLTDLFTGNLVLCRRADVDALVAENERLKAAAPAGPPPAYDEAVQQRRQR